MNPKQGTKTYFLAPGWEMHSPSLLLGSIIANPSQPDIALYKPADSSLSVSIETSSPSSFSTSTAASSVGLAGLFSTFLSVVGLGDEPAFSFDRKHILSYSFHGQRLVQLNPPPELLRTAVAEGPVAQLFANGMGVYMVTGLKTVSGAGVKVASAKGRGWVVELGVESTREGQGEDEEGNAVFALQIAEVKLQEGREVVLEELDVDAGVLQAKLDKEFGDGAFKVIEGLDEASTNAEEVCLVVTSSPTCVDLLTAGTVKVGGEHGIWY